MKSGIKVVAPASVSNLACGFDALGMALDIPCDEIIGRWTDTPGIRITEITGRKSGIPTDPAQNVAGKTAMALLRHVGETGRGLELRIHKHIPGGSGLGSSGASAAAAAHLVNEMLGRPLDKRDLVPLAVEGEQLASITPVGDNVIPSLLGGLMLIRDIDSFDFHRIYTPPGLVMAILLPDMRIATRESRAMLRTEVPLSDAVRQAAHLGAFVIGMLNSDLDLIGRSMQDFLIEPQRRNLVPHFDAVKEAALLQGALGCSLSGSGPAIFALCKERLEAERTAEGMMAVYGQYKLEARTFVAGMSAEGAQLR